jgi:starvation-inducible DNA-binding protein
MPEPIPSTLDERARATAGAALQATLVDLIDLSLVAKQAHWNLIGRQFHDVHLHLDELVNLARTYTDEVAERAAATGVAYIQRVPAVVYST